MKSRICRIDGSSNSIDVVGHVVGHVIGATVVPATEAEPGRHGARLRDATYADVSNSKLNVSVISEIYRFAMIEKANYLRDKAARLRGYAHLESDPGVCRALLTRAGDCESLAKSLEDNLEAGGRRPAASQRNARYA